ncbi:MAG: hypothetical protein PHX08_01110 [Lachnospiraceae bacterium]|nr:hypothetical protein [Lachnospiraceae bacterium]
MKIRLKVQKEIIDAAKHDYAGVNFEEYDDKVLILLHGAVGIYLDKKDVIINFEKLEDRKVDMFELDPETITAGKVFAEKTKDLKEMEFGVIAVRIAAPENNRYINVKYLKYFEDIKTFMMGGQYEPVLVINNDNKVAGFILPIEIKKEEQIK